MNRFGLLFTCPIIIAISTAISAYLPANNASIAMQLFLVFVWSLVIWIRYRARPMQYNVVHGFKTEVKMLYILECTAIMTTLVVIVATLVDNTATALANTPQAAYIDTLTPVTWISVLTCAVSYAINVLQFLSNGSSTNTSRDSVTANVWLEVILAATCAQAALIALVVFMYYQPQ